MVRNLIEFKINTNNQRFVKNTAQLSPLSIAALTGLHNRRAVNVPKVSTFFSVSKTRLSRWVVCTLLGKNAIFVVSSAAAQC